MYNRGLLSCCSPGSPCCFSPRPESPGRFFLPYSTSSLPCGAGALKTPVRESQREVMRERERHRHIQKERERHTERETERGYERERETQRDRQTDRERYTDRERERERKIFSIKFGSLLLSQDTHQCSHTFAISPSFSHTRTHTRFTTLL